MFLCLLYTLSTGAPSQPITPTYSVSGTLVTVSVTVQYPGTRGVLRLYIGYQSVGNESGEVEENVPVTDPSQGIMRRIDVELPVGQYKVYVRAENEFGNLTSEISDVFTITSSYACACAFVSILLHLHNILCIILLHQLSP